MQEQSYVAVENMWVADSSCSRHVLGNEKSLREWRVVQEEKVRGESESESEKSSSGTGMGDNMDIQKLAGKDESYANNSEVNFLDNFADIFTKGFDQSCFQDVVEFKGMFNPE